VIVREIVHRFPIDSGNTVARRVTVNVSFEEIKSAFLLRGTIQVSF